MVTNLETKSKIKCLLFDLDGTLYNSLNGIAYCCNKALEKYNLKEYETLKYLDFIGNGEKLLLERAIGYDNLNEVIFNKVKLEYDRLYQIYYSQDCKPYDGIIDMVNDLKEKGIVVGILSNKPDEFVKEINKKVFDNIFSIAVGQREGYKVKPDKETICEILKSLKIKNTECAYVGDSYVDVLTAKNAETISVAVTYGFGNIEKTLQQNPDYICKSVEELRTTLLQLTLY